MGVAELLEFGLSRRALTGRGVFLILYGESEMVVEYFAKLLR